MRIRIIPSVIGGGVVFGVARVMLTLNVEGATEAGGNDTLLVRAWDFAALFIDRIFDPSDAWILWLSLGAVFGGQLHGYGRSFEDRLRGHQGGPPFWYLRWLARSVCLGIRHRDQRLSASIFTDEGSGWEPLYASHNVQQVNHSKEFCTDEGCHTNGAESAFRSQYLVPQLDGTSKRPTPHVFRHARIDEEIRKLDMLYPDLDDFAASLIDFADAMYMSPENIFRYAAGTLHKRRMRIRREVMKTNVEDLRQAIIDSGSENIAKQIVERMRQCQR